MKYKILLVPFPFDDLSRDKVRPVVCLTDPIGAYRHIVVAFITSHIPMPRLATDLVIMPSDAGFEATGLRTASTLQLHRLMTVATKTVLRELGELPVHMQEQVKKKLVLLFNL
jgi:mRNA interferase MazF